MYIYIDESGLFSNPKGNPFQVPCIACLIIPSLQQDKIFSEYIELKNNWVIQGEIKGSKLNEDQISSVISLLKKYEVFVEICAIDLGMHTEWEITLFKSIQADALTKNIDRRHKPTLVQEIVELQSSLRRLNNQLFVQTFVFCEAIYDVVQLASMYYCQIFPEELTSFNWVVDAKNSQITDYEKIWLKIVLPFLQDKSFKEPFIEIEGMNYSFMDRFRVSYLEVPEYLRGSVRNPDKPLNGFDIRKIITEKISFADSSNELGLQLVDIIGSCFTRAIKGHLQRPGWDELGALMFMKRGGKAIKFIGFSTSKLIVENISPS